METNRSIIAEIAIGIGFLIINKFKNFTKQSKPASKELIEIHLSDDDDIPFKTGEEAWQYAKEIESRLQPRIIP